VILIVTSPKVAFAEDGQGSVDFAPLLVAAFDAMPAHTALIDERGVIVAVNAAWREYGEANGLRWPRHGVGRSYLEPLLLARDNGEAAAASQGIRSVLVGQAAFFEMNYVCAEPLPTWFEMRVAPFSVAGRRYAAVSHTDITEAKLAEAELQAAREAVEAAHREQEAQRAAVDTRRQVTEAVTDMLAVVNRTQDADTVIQGMLQRAVNLLGSDAGAVYSAEERWDRPVLVTACGELPLPTRKGASPIPAQHLARAINDQRPVGFLITERQPRGRRIEPEDTCYPAMLLAPIYRRNKLHGYLVLHYGCERTFGEDEVELGHLFARQMSLALEQADLRDEREREAIAGERNRLARDLHDAVTQTLFSASVVAEALPKVMERDPEEGKRALEELRLWTRGALAEMRTLLLELRPAALIEKSLADLVRQLGEVAATRARVAVSFDADCECELPDDVKLAFYRISQEALNNMVKHSRADRVNVHLVATDREAQLTIADNGRGFEGAPYSNGQLGLGIMRERAESVGARLNIRSVPAGGTTVRVTWRMQAERRPHA
jgi:signal transduction histidine kinase